MKICPVCGGADHLYCGQVPNDPMPNDPVNHPRHYTSHASGVECIEVTEHMNFNIGNAVKYLWRSDHKNGLEDLKKAAWYVNREIERLTKLAPILNHPAQQGAYNG